MVGKHQQATLRTDPGEAFAGTAAVGKVKLDPVAALQAVNLLDGAFLFWHWRWWCQFSAQHDGVNFDQRIEEGATITALDVDQVKAAVKARQQCWNQADQLKAIFLIAFWREAPGQVLDDGDRILPLQAFFGVQQCRALEHINPEARQKIARQMGQGAL